MKASIGILVLCFAFVIFIMVMGTLEARHRTQHHFPQAGPEIGDSTYVHVLRIEQMLKAR